MANGGTSRGCPKRCSEKSRRTAEIEAAAKGITDPDAKGALGAKTRKHKDDLDMETLRGCGATGCPPETIGRWRTCPRTSECRRGQAAVRDPVDGRPCRRLRYAVATLFERQSVVPERQVLDAALRYGRGAVSRSSSRRPCALPGAAS